MRRPLRNILKAPNSYFSTHPSSLEKPGSIPRALTAALAASFPPLLQVPDAAGERGGFQPPEPALEGHPDPAGPAGRGPRQRHRAHGQRDQPVAAMGGEQLEGRGDGDMGLGLLPQGQGSPPKVPPPPSPRAQRKGVTAKSFPFPD